MPEAKPKYTKPKTKAKPLKFRAKISRMWHPAQEVYVTTTEPVELKFDSWTESQVQAGLIEECK